MPFNWKKMSDTFCVMPWVQLATRPNGDVRTCCLMSNANTKERGCTDINLKKDRFYDSWNSKFQTQVRKDLLNGIKNPNCKTCWEKEEVGLLSRRQFSSKLFKDDVTEELARENTDNSGNTLLQPVSFDLRFGNLCNLKCVMCHPDNSTSWVSDYVKIWGPDHAKDWNFNWYENENFWNDMEKNIHSIKHIYMCGGEPLLIKNHDYFLQKCVEGGYAKNIKLEYDSNITIVRDHIIDLWSHFKHVFVRASIDDYGEQNDYIRHPSRFKVIQKNLKKLDNADILLGISMSISIFNSCTFKNLFDYVKSEFHDRSGRLDVKISPRMVTNPSYLDMRNLPQPAKDYIINEINYDYISDYLKYKPNNTKENFTQYADKLDSLRSTNWRETFKQLSSFYE